MCDENYQNTMRFDKVIAKIGEGCNFFASQCSRALVLLCKGAGSYLAGMAVAIPILNVDGRRHTNNFSKNI